MAAERTRSDGRASDTLRDVTIETRVQRFPEGSVLYRAGGTTVLVSASIDDGVRDFLRGSGKGWVTAEYAMHPRANRFRQPRDGRRGGGIDGRVQEIQRLVGRALRAAVIPSALGERTITIDCDVLDADGGTRTASITGGFVALALALDRLRQAGTLSRPPLRSAVAAVSAGLVAQRVLLDLCYEEDRDAAVDLNVVATPTGNIVEVQGTAEDAPVPRAAFDQLVEVALGGIATLGRAQKDALAAAGVDLGRLFAPNPM
ncbi:MAG: ribonuclease PH [Deltaproteobacteria bacterium]|nr:ribonuclease PH [Deltaproteobacteria bacterium]